MNNDIYQQDIKALAVAAHGAGQFSIAEKNTNTVITLDNPLCGDRVTLAVVLEAGKISHIKHEVKGCLLCRAAASVIGESAIGSSADEIDILLGDLSLMLKEGVEINQPQWLSLLLFKPVSQHKSRHACVLLPFKALAEACRR